MININAGHNQEFMEKCQALKEYAALVASVRDNLSKGLEIKSAVDNAVSMIINSHGVLADLLKTHRAEVIDVCITEFDEGLHEQTLLNEGRDEGRKEERLSQICRMIKKNYLKEDILDLGFTEEEYLEAEGQLLSHV